MDLSRTPRIFMGTIRILGRALLGAVAGLIVVSLTLFIATDYFNLFTFGNSVAGTRSFWKVVSLGSLAFALIATIAGETKIRGRAGDTIKGVLAGTLVGVMIGPALGFTAGDDHALQRKAGTTLGIFLGGPIGAIIGGILGANQDALGRRK